MPAPLTRVVAAVIERGDRVLVALRPAGKRHGGMWELPGGKVEGAESDLDAIRRELAEELGLRVISISLPIAAFEDHGSEHLIVFISAVVEGEPECREHAAVRWTVWSDLEALQLAPADRRFISSRQSNKL